MKKAFRKINRSSHLAFAGCEIQNPQASQPGGFIFPSVADPILAQLETFSRGEKKILGILLRARHDCLTKAEEENLDNQARFSLRAGLIELPRWYLAVTTGYTMRHVARLLASLRAKAGSQWVKKQWGRNRCGYWARLRNVYLVDSLIYTLMSPLDHYYTAEPEVRRKVKILRRSSLRRALNSLISDSLIALHGAVACPHQGTPSQAKPSLRGTVVLRGRNPEQEWSYQKLIRFGIFKTVADKLAVLTDTRALIQDTLYNYNKYVVKLSRSGVTIKSPQGLLISLIKRKMERISGYNYRSRTPAKLIWSGGTK